MKKMNDNVYEQAERIIRERRNNAIKENEKRNNEIDKKIPAIAEIKNKQMKYLSSRLLAIIQSGENVAEKIQHEKRYNAQAASIVRAYLKNYNYPEDYLEIKYTCPQCSDTGYNGGKKCECFMELIKKLSIENVNIDTHLTLSTFDSFSLEYYDDGKFSRSMHKIYEYCVEYAHNFDPCTSPSIIMSGNTGLGKTHLSLAIAREAIQKGYNVAYDSAINFLRHIENEHFGRVDYGYDTLDKLIDSDLLIIDDLGAEYDSRFYTATIYNIINSRMTYSRPTIISTNMNSDEIRERYDERVFSRICYTYDYLHFRGADVRLLRKRNKTIID